MGAQSYLPIEILDYVETHAPPEDSATGISQRELAKVLGYHPCSMSRPLGDLVRDGLLSVRRAPVRDGTRKQLTYRITDVGRTHLRKETKEVPLLSAEMPPPPHPFLGRKDELAQLGEIASAGGSVTFVDGAPGMGKTALVARHMRRTKQSCIPFWFAARPSTSPRQFVLALAHGLASIGGQQLAYYSQLPRPPVPRETADLVARAVGSRKLVVVIDDIQVGGSDFQGFLRDLVESLVSKGDHQFIFVGQEAPYFATESVVFHRLTIGGLDRVAAHDLTDRHGGLADRFETVYQSTLGSPLLLQLAVSNPGIEADASSIPTAVIQRLPLEKLRSVLPVALANEPLPGTFVTEDCGLPAEQVAELVRMGVLHRTLQGRVEILQVVRTAILARTAPSDEREAHLELARFYSRTRRPEAVRERFLHLVDGESWRQAAQLLTQQERVILRLGFSENLRGALRHLATVLSKGTARVRVLEAEGSFLRAHSDYSDAIVSYRRAALESSEDPRSECENLLAIVDLQIRLRDLEQARRDLDAARKIGPISRRLHAYFALTEGRLFEAEGDNHAAQGRYELAFETARKTKNTDLALESIAAWSRLEERQTGPEVALRLVSAALPEARQANRLDVVFNLLLVRARAYVRMGKDQEAESDLRQVRTDAEALGYVNQLAHALSGLTAIAAREQRWSEAMNYSKQAIALAERLGNDLVLGHTLGILCSIEWRLSQEGGGPELLDEALNHGKMGVEVLNRIAPTDSLALAHSNLADVYTIKRDPDAALMHYQKALDIANKLEMGWLREMLVTEVGPQIEALAKESKASPQATAT